MHRRRFYQTVVLTCAAAFVLLLAFKFRPRIETPTPVPPSKSVRAGEGTFSAENFRHVQSSGEKMDFVLTAELATDTNDGVKLLTRPRLESPTPSGSSDVISGAKGSLDDVSKDFRVYDGASLSVSGWECSSSGFHLSADGTASSESDVRFRRGDISGTSSSIKYDRRTREAMLEGGVRIEGRGSVMVCESLTLSLASHGGEIVGPVVISSPDGKFAAPRGKIRLSGDDRLESLDLGSPFSGTGPRGDLRADRLTVIAGNNGKPSAYRLKGRAELVAAGSVPLKVSSESLLFSPEKNGVWAWSSDSSIEVERGGEKAKARRGEGSLGGGTAAEIRLSGPVSGSGDLGDFKANQATLKDGTWNLVGDAFASRGGSSILANRIGWATGDGSAEASGDVRGQHQPQGQRDPVIFRAQVAEMGSGGFPYRLGQGATVEMGGLLLAAPTIEASTASLAKASGGATGSAKNPKGGEDKISAPVIDYDGDLGIVTASGGAKAEARGYTLTADSISAKLDEKRHPILYEAMKGAAIKGPEYEGEGDLISFDPGKRGGKATRESPEAFVVTNNPYRRIAAQTVFFSPDHIEAHPLGEPPLRGLLEGIPSGPQKDMGKPPARRKGTP